MSSELTFKDYLQEHEPGTLKLFEALEAASSFRAAHEGEVIIPKKFDKVLRHGFIGARSLFTRGIVADTPALVALKGIFDGCAAAKLPVADTHRFANDFRNNTLKRPGAYHEVMARNIQ